MLRQRQRINAKIASRSAGQLAVSVDIEDNHEHGKDFASSTVVLQPFKPEGSVHSRLRGSVDRHRLRQDAHSEGIVSEELTRASAEPQRVEVVGELALPDIFVRPSK